MKVRKASIAHIRMHANDGHLIHDRNSLSRLLLVLLLFVVLVLF